jgi:tetratricopeptide (TPR) repeat protein
VTSETARALLSQASALRRAGRVAEAIIAYEQLLALDPGLPDSWYNLGWLQRQARNFEGALSSYAQALARSVSTPEEVHLNRAVILSDHLSRFDEAREELERALEINPVYVPALLNLGNLAEDRGDRAGARAAYQRALDGEPSNCLVLARFAGVSDPDEGLADRLRAAIDSPDVEAADRAALGFALGRLLDAAGDYDEAFVAYTDANRASRDAPGFQDYDPVTHEQFVDRLIATFDKPVTATAQSREAPPLFICGMFRSGSTLVERMLAAHDKIVAGGELDLIPSIVESLVPYPEAARDPEAVAHASSVYVESLSSIRAAGKMVTDKRPDNFLHIGLIKAMFPDARIIHTRRNPLDNILSLYFLHLDPGMAYALDIEDAAHWYGQYQRLMDHWKSLYGADMFDVEYDNLVENPQPVAEALLAFCGLDWDERCLSPHRVPGSVRTASVWQVREPLHQRSSGRWRHYRAQLGELRKLFPQA